LKFVKTKFRGVYASLVFSSKMAGFELGFKLLKMGGVLIPVGLPVFDEGPMPVSLVGNVEEMRELVQLAAEGKVKTHVGRVANLSEINQVFDELGKGKFVGRAIIDNFLK
ncbi:MAG: zinc-dependent alcohol dehydrogenase, partial [Promethearchaeota archaeon]|jgi:D-arabinose 1-dehydrogenase-like Zn-dependent alcohol dehydrogenase